MQYFSWPCNLGTFENSKLVNFGTWPIPLMINGWLILSYLSWQIGWQWNHRLKNPLDGGVRCNCCWKIQVNQWLDTYQGSLPQSLWIQDEYLLWLWCIWDLGKFTLDVHWFLEEKRWSTPELTWGHRTGPGIAQRDFRQSNGPNTSQNPLIQWFIEGGRGFMTRSIQFCGTRAVGAWRPLAFGKVWFRRTLDDGIWWFGVFGGGVWCFWYVLIRLNGSAFSSWPRSAGYLSFVEGTACAGERDNCKRECFEPLGWFDFFSFCLIGWDLVYCTHLHSLKLTVRPWK